MSFELKYVVETNLVRLGCCFIICFSFTFTVLKILYLSDKMEWVSVVCMDVISVSKLLQEGLAWATDKRL